MEFVWYIGTTQLKARGDLKLTKLSAIISPYLAKFIKHNKLLLHEMVIIFSSFYLPETTYVISSFSLRSIPDAMIIS